MFAGVPPELYGEIGWALPAPEGRVGAYGLLLGGVVFLGAAVAGGAAALFIGAMRLGKAPLLLDAPAAGVVG